MNWLDKLERKFGRYAIHNLMNYIIVLYALGYIILTFVPDFYFQYLALDPSAILQGQIWRIITFIVYPPSTALLFPYKYVPVLYDRKSTGKPVGAFRFNMYFFSGVLLHVVAAFLCLYGFGMNLGLMFGTYYLNFSLFFAFAATYPDMQFLLFFIIPIKAKWLGIINGIDSGVTIIAGFFVNYLPYNVIRGLFSAGITAHPANSVMALVSGNFLLFFFGMRMMRRYNPKEVYRRRAYAKSVNQGQKKECGDAQVRSLRTDIKGRRRFGVSFLLQV